MDEEPQPLEVDELTAIKQRLMQLEKEELADRLAFYEYVIPKLGPFVQWCINNFYRPVIAHWRMGRQAVGLLVGAVLVPEQLILLADEEIRDYTRKKIKYERRLVTVPVKELSYYDVVLEDLGEKDMEGY